MFKLFSCLSKFIVKNIVYSIFVLIGVLSVSFLLLYVVPGDPAKAILGERADSVTVMSVRTELGLDKPLYVQYFTYIEKALRGNIGKSYVSNRDVLKTILEKIPATFILALTSLIIASILGVFFGVVSAVKQNSFLDRILMLFSLSGISIPQFALGLIMILIFGVVLNLLPISGYISDGGIQNLILPAFTLALRPLAIISRITRASMLDVLRADYIRTAKSKGVPDKVIIIKHTLRNALNPIITTLSQILAATLGGAFFVEYIFNWHGIGQLAIESIMKLDFPMIQGTVLFTAVIFVFVNFLTDVLYAFIDPKVRLG